MLDKELQDLVWSILPVEFRTLVKKMYKNKENTPEQLLMLRLLFGFDNLTSDTDGEEMLHTDPKRVRELYKNYCAERNKEDAGTANRLSLSGRIAMLQELFGNKCLPKLENEMCFDVGAKVVYHPFKSISFYDATILEIREGEDKPYLLHLEGAENIWAYPIEVQSIAETYPLIGRPCDNPLAEKEGCRYKNGDGNCSFNSACYFEPQDNEETKFQIDDKVRFPIDADNDKEGTVVHINDKEQTYIIKTADGQAYTVFEHNLEPLDKEQPDYIEVDNEMVGRSTSDFEDVRDKCWKEFCDELQIEDAPDEIVDPYIYGFGSGYNFGLKASAHGDNLKATYESCCEEYRRRINEQWSLDIKDSWWIPSDRTGMTLALCDLEYSLSMEDVRLMVDLGISYEAFNEWWNHCVSGDPEDYHINAYNWFVNGCRPKDFEQG